MRDDFSRFMTDLDITNGAGSLVTNVIPNPKGPPLPGQVLDADREFQYPVTAALLIIDCPSPNAQPFHVSPLIVCFP